MIEGVREKMRMSKRKIEEMKMIFFSSAFFIAHHKLQHIFLAVFGLLEERQPSDHNHVVVLHLPWRRGLLVTRHRHVNACGLVLQWPAKVTVYYSIIARDSVEPIYCGAKKKIDASSFGTSETVLIREVSLFQSRQIKLISQFL